LCVTKRSLFKKCDERQRADKLVVSEQQLLALHWLLHFSPSGKSKSLQRLKDGHAQGDVSYYKDRLIEFYLQLVSREIDHNLK